MFLLTKLAGGVARLIAELKAEAEAERIGVADYRARQDQAQARARRLLWHLHVVPAEQRREPKV